MMLHSIVLRPLEFKRCQRGMTLVEIMVAMAIDLVLLIAITGYVIQQNNLRNELEKTSRQIENGRYALFILQQDINHAGYYGAWEPPITQPPSLPNPCETSPSTADYSLVLPIQGYNNPTSPPSCLPDYKTGTDILVIRRADTNESPVVTPITNEVYLQASSTSEGSPFDQALGIQFAAIQYGNPDGFTLGSLNSDNSISTVGTKADGGTALILKKANVAGASPLNTTPRIAANIHKYHVHIYYISPCSNATGTASDPAGVNKPCLSTDDNGSPIPTLKRLELTVVNGNRQFKLVPLVEGIDNMQFDYGIDRNLDGTPDSTSVISDNSYLMAPATTDWVNVMMVKVHLLARNIEKTANCPSSNPPDYCTKVYSLGLSGNYGPYTDGYKRHVFSESVLVVNPVKRRQQ